MSFFNNLIKNMNDLHMIFRDSISPKFSLQTDLHSTIPVVIIMVADPRARAYALQAHSYLKLNPIIWSL